MAQTILGVSGPSPSDTMITLKSIHQQLLDCRNVQQDQRLQLENILDSLQPRMLDVELNPKEQKVTMAPRGMLDDLDFTLKSIEQCQLVTKDLLSLIATTI